jgi:hypothetical protein
MEYVNLGASGFDLALDPALVKRLSDASRWAR